jgi:hypothetical protein
MSFDLGPLHDVGLSRPEPQVNLKLVTNREPRLQGFALCEDSNTSSEGVSQPKKPLPSWFSDLEGFLPHGGSGACATESPPELHVVLAPKRRGERCSTGSWLPRGWLFSFESAALFGLLHLVSRPVIQLSRLLGLWIRPVG